MKQIKTMAMRTLVLNKHKWETIKELSDSYTTATERFYGLSRELDGLSRANLHSAGYAIVRTEVQLQAGLTGTALQDALRLRRGYVTADKNRRKLNLKRAAQGKNPKRDIREPGFGRPLPITVRNDVWRLVKTGAGFMLRVPTTGEKSSSLDLPLEMNHYNRDILEAIHAGTQKRDAVKLRMRENRVCDVILSYGIETTPEMVVQEWLGVDLGIVNTAVDSDGNFHCGRSTRYRKNRWVERRRELQKAGRLARVKEERGSERRWVHALNHRISNEIVELAKDTDRGIALEALRGIHNRTDAGSSRKLRGMNHGWSFNELKEMIEYKAKIAGVPFLLVDPRNTSKMCSRCGHISDGNRPKRDEFKCCSCGFELNADLNAARNIAERAKNNYAERVDLARKGECGTPDGSRPPVILPGPAQADL